MASLRIEIWKIVIFASFLFYICYITLPILSVFVRVGSDFITQLSNPVVVSAIKLSIITSSVTALVAIVVGTPVAYALARWRFRYKHALETLIELPIVLPPAVAGVALLMAFGRNGLVGSYAPMDIAFTTLAVIMAQSFVATPFYVRSMKSAFDNLDTKIEGVARTLGASEFRTFVSITLPLTVPSFVGGLVMCWARALGEFGATLMFAGNFIGRTQTMPLAIYSALQTDLQSALSLSVILIILSFTILVFVKIFGRRVGAFV
jgi:molybdate transport system permease protein